MLQTHVKNLIHKITWYTDTGFTHSSSSMDMRSPNRNDNVLLMITTGKQAYHTMSSNDSILFSYKNQY